MARRARTRKRRRGGRRRRRNGGMPVVLVNPRGRGRRRRGRRRRRRNPVARRRRSSSYRRRRNPRANFTGALMATGLGMVGGGLAYGMDWGVSYAKVSHTIQTLAFGGLGLATSIGVAMLADERVGAGIAGGTSAILFGRVREGIALARLGKGEKKTDTKAAAEAGRVYRQPYDAGAYQRRDEALTMRAGFAGTSFKQPEAAAVFRETGAVYRETGASRYIPGPVRWFGPHSWAYNTQETGKVVRYVSAHSASR